MVIERLSARGRVRYGRFHCTICLCIARHEYVIDTAWQSVLYGLYSPYPQGCAPRIALFPGPCPAFHRLFSSRFFTWAWESLGMRLLLRFGTIQHATDMLIMITTSQRWGTCTLLGSNRQCVLSMCILVLQDDNSTGTLHVPRTELY